MLCKSRAGVIPAKAGIQKAVDLLRLSKTWIPAFAGMTVFCRGSLEKNRTAETQRRGEKPYRLSVAPLQILAE
jgi:hypothetical protein